MNKAIGIALVAAGIALIVWGINASDSVSSDFSRFFTGSPTNKTMWLLTGGIVSLVAGGVMAMRPAR
jgi:hypothetical protein